MRVERAMKETQGKMSRRRVPVSTGSWGLIIYGLGQQKLGVAQPGILNESVRLFPVGQQLRRLLIPDAYIVIGKALREEVVNLPGHVQDVTYSVPEGPKPEYVAKEPGSWPFLLDSWF